MSAPPAKQKVLSALFDGGCNVRNIQRNIGLVGQRYFACYCNVLYVIMEALNTK